MFLSIYWFNVLLSQLVIGLHVTFLGITKSKRCYFCKIALNYILLSLKCSFNTILYKKLSKQFNLSQLRIRLCFCFLFFFHFFLSSFFYFFFLSLSVERITLPNFYSSILTGNLFTKTCKFYARSCSLL